MPSEEIEKFRIIESRKNYEAADQWLRNFREATWDEVRTFIRFYMAPGDDMMALLADCRRWESKDVKPFQARVNGHPLDDDLSLGMAHFRKELDYLSIVGSTIRPTGYTESVSWSILSRDYFLAPFNAKGVSGGFLTITGRPRTGKTGVACLYGEMWLKEYRASKFLTNIPLERETQDVIPVTTMNDLLHAIADSLEAEQRWLWAYDEPSMSGWMKSDAPSGRSKNLERFARIIPKLGGSFIYIEQRQEGVPTTIQDFAQSHIFCNELEGGSVFADLPGKRWPILHVPKPRQIRYRTGEAGYFDIPADFPWDDFFRALRFDPLLNTIKVEEPSNQAERIKDFLRNIEPKIVQESVRCRFCGHAWVPRLEEPPARCPKCMKRNPLGEKGELPLPEPAIPAPIELTGQPPMPPQPPEP